MPGAHQYCSAMAKPQKDGTCCAVQHAKPCASRMTPGPLHGRNRTDEPQHHSNKQAMLGIRTKRGKQCRQGQEMHPAGATNPWDSWQKRRGNLKVETYKEFWNPIHSHRILSTCIGSETFIRLLYSVQCKRLIVTRAEFTSAGEQWPLFHTL